MKRLVLIGNALLYRSSIAKDIELTSERKAHILLYHPDLKPHFSKIKKVLLKPDEIRISKSDQSVLLLYRYFDNIDLNKYIVVVVKINERKFILTAYLSDRILSGEKYVQK